MRAHHSLIILTLSVLSGLLAACTGVISTASLDAVDNPNDPEKERSPNPPPKPELIKAHSFTNNPGVRRLTRVEYAHTINSLLSLEVRASDVPAELTIEGTSHISAAQKVGYEDIERFYTLGAQLAKEAAPKLAAQNQCGQAQECWQTWGAKFIVRAFRGAAPDSIKQRHLEILKAPEAGDDELARLETFLSAILSSPWFLYRREIGADPVQELPGAKWLSGDEIAARLSYLIWQDQPDETLLEAGMQGLLKTPEQRRLQLERMLADPRARAGMSAFVADWMSIFEETINTKAPEVLAGTSAQLPAYIKDSFDELVAQTLLERPDAGYVDLLSATSIPVNDELSALLALSPVEDTALVWQALDPKQRLGILTHPRTIAAHSKESGASPFPIGAFVYENILCEKIPVIEQIPTFEEDPTSAQMTLRQQLEAKTSAAQCAACHTRIGPVGFAFLPFDPIGRYRAADPQGRPYDTAGQIPVAGQTLSFHDISDLAVQLAEHPATAQCIAHRLFRWTYGRFESPRDLETLAPLRELAVDQKTAVRKILLALVTSEAFIQARHEVKP